MRDLDSWEIGVRGLKIPFAQLPTLLASLLPSAIVLAASLAVFSAAGMAKVIDISQALPLSTELARIAFEWSWMMALWHTTLRQCLTFPMHRNFWLYLVVFGVITLAGEAAIAGIGFSIEHSGLRQGQQFVMALVLMIIWLPIIWISLRLAIWPAAIVANQRWVSPAEIWRATRGMAWDILFILLVVSVPALVLGGGLLMGARLLTAATHSPFGTEIMIGGFGLLGAYVSAAIYAALLLAYHDVCVAPKGAGRRGASAPSQA